MTVQQRQPPARGKRERTDVWPSDHPHPFKERWQAQRDVIGDLAAARPSVRTVLLRRRRLDVHGHAAQEPYRVDVVGQLD
jgi:hypothetical protein